MALFSAMAAMIDNLGIQKVLIVTPDKYIYFLLSYRKGQIDLHTRVCNIISP
jgi:hypothetical protein